VNTTTQEPHTTLRPRSSGIELDGVVKRYGDHVAFDSPVLTVPEGSLTVLVGPSGCGKSTALRLIAGLEIPDRGRVRIGSTDVTTESAGTRDVAMVFQDFALYPHLTVAGNVGFALRLEAKHSRGAGPSRREIDERVDAACQMLGLGDKQHRRPSELSGGERQRVALARAIVRRKPVLLLDEPLSSLDAQLRVQARAELIRLHREVQGTFVLVTHDQMEALSMATHLVVLDAGKVEQAGPPETIWNRPANTFVARFVGSPAMNLAPSGGSEAVVGWRPADGRLITSTGFEARADGLVVEGVVDVIEFAGEHRLAHCRGPAGTWSVMLSATDRVHLDERIRVAVEPPVLHYFDERTGARIDEPRVPLAASAS